MPRETLKVGKRIGTGGFCDVHDATPVDEDGQRVGPDLAYKRLKSDAAKSPELLARFQREVRLMDTVLDHPNIISVVMRNVTVDRPWYAMPKAEANLNDEIKAGRWKDEDWVMIRFREILDAMAYSHADKNVIHRDLKPNNILILEETAKVTDFGLGKALEAGTVGLTKTNAWFGTEPYMAPEQFTEMKDTGPEADVFSLGKLLMKMLTGKTPLVGVPNVAALPERFRYFVQRCCSEKPENRYPNAKAAREAFDRIMGDNPFSELPSETLQRLVEDWWHTGDETDEETQVVRWIDEHLRTNHEDEAMYLKEVPDLPEDLIDQYMDRLPDEFAAMLAIYDGYVSGALPFEYCDDVTVFYERIFRRADDLRLRDMILRRLFQMGKSHNRWYVRTRVIEMLGEVNDPSTVAMASDVIREEAAHSDWFAEKAKSASLPAAVRKAFRDVA